MSRMQFKQAAVRIDWWAALKQRNFRFSQWHSRIWTFWPLLFFPWLKNNCICSHWTWFTTCSWYLTPQCFVGSELCSFEPVSQEFVRLQKKCTAFRKFKIMQPKSFFAKGDISMFHHFSKKLNWLPVKERILFKIALCFSFLWWYPATISVIRFSVYSPFQFRWRKNFFLCKMDTQWLWSPVVLFWGTPCLEVFLPTSDTVVPSHSSKLLLRPSSSLLPSPSYLDPLEDFRSPPPSRWRMLLICQWEGEWLRGREREGDWVRERVM